MSQRAVTIPTLDSPVVSKVPEHLHVRAITKADFDAIVQVVDHWWDGPIAVLAHPMFFYEFGREARVVIDERVGRLVGFLLGFVVPPHEGAPSIGYVHLVGIDPAYRRQGVARALYQDFARTCAAAGCQKIKATTTVGNEGSVRFHEALGFTIVEDPDYAGPGRRRLVMTRPV